MERQSSTLNQLKEILDSGAFSKLRPFKSSKKWSEMSTNERELLGYCFVKQAEKYFINGDERAKEVFDLAFQLLPGDCRVYCQKGMIYGSHPQGAYHDEAVEAFSLATTLDSRYFDAWRGWGTVLFRMGTLCKDDKYFAMSLEKFQKAENVLNKETADGDFYWQWGVCWYQSGSLSGEPCDFHCALEKMQMAATYGVKDPHFWNDYGNIKTELFCLVSKTELLEDSINCYKQAVKMSPNYFDAWFNLGSTYHRMYEKKREEEFFKASCECYQNATFINPDNYIAWGKWGQLLAWAGKFGRQVDLLEESFDKFEKALSLKSDLPVLLAAYAEALILVGGYNENHCYLRQAEEKLDRAVHLRSNDPDIWCLYGECYNELGRYFQDRDYYHKAMAKFKQGLVLNRKHFMLWFGMALTFLAVGELDKDKRLFEKAILFFSRVGEFSTDTPPMFWCQWGIAFLKLAQITHDRRYAQSALDKLQKALTFYPKNGPIELDCLFNLGCTHDMLGDFDDDHLQYQKAIQIFEDIIEQEPRHKASRHQLALCYTHLAESTTEVSYYGKAHEQFQHLLLQDSEDATAWNDWGYALLSLAYLVQDPTHPNEGDVLFKQSEANFEQSVALGNTEAFYNLACLHSLKGNLELALHFLERAEKADSLPPLGTLLEDEWLHQLRKSDLFVHFYNRHLGSES